MHIRYPDAEETSSPLRCRNTCAHSRCCCRDDDAAHLNLRLLPAMVADRARMPPSPVEVSRGGGGGTRPTWDHPGRSDRKQRHRAFSPFPALEAVSPSPPPVTERHGQSLSALRRRRPSGGVLFWEDSAFLLWIPSTARDPLSPGRVLGPKPCRGRFESCCISGTPNE